MLEKPALPDDRIAACLQASFGVRVADIDFLPLGADPNSAVYRAVGADGAAYFVKLRRGAFHEMAVMLPRYLSANGVPAIIPPIAMQNGRLWSSLDDFTLTLYPFVRGRTASEVRLSEQQWRDFGAAMKALHTIRVPAVLAARIPRETYSAEGREQVRAFLKLAEDATFEDPVAAQLVAFLKNERAAILDFMARAERHASALRSRAPDFVVCHSDVHADNLLIDERGVLHIVDWDEPIFATKERDLMFIGGGQRFAGYIASEERELFYRGYGAADVDGVAVAYHRYERILQDILVACRQLLLTQDGGANRAHELGNLPPNFLPNGTIDLARRADPDIDSMRIRNADARDLPMLAAIEAAADTVFPEGRLPNVGSTYPADELAQAMRDGLLQVADVEGVVVGFAVSDVIGPVLHLYLLAVHPDHGRRGIGKALVECVIAESARRELSGVTLTTFEDLKWNAPFYRKLGFRILSGHEQTPMLASVLANEHAAGLRSRVAMRLDN